MYFLSLTMIRCCSIPGLLLGNLLTLRGTNFCLWEEREDAWGLFLKGITRKVFYI